MGSQTGSNAGILSYPPPRRHPLDPPPEYDWLREHEPVVRVRLADGRAAWLITRYDDVRAVYADSVRFSSDRRHPGFPVRLSARATYEDNPPLLVGMDGAEHAEMRRGLMAEFTNKRIAALRPRIQQIVDRFIDGMLAGDRPADLVAALAVPVPVVVICEHLGVPVTDQAYFRDLTIQLIDPQVAESKRGAVSAELMSYLGDLVAAKDKEPADDLLSRQLRKQREPGSVDRRMLVSQAFLLLVSGHETTASMIQLGVLALLKHPEQLAAIQADAARMPRAVDELLRYFSPVEHITCRVATEDVYLRGVLIRAGDGVIMCGPAANRDGSVFTDPDRLDTGRAGAHHLAFGHGPHQCIGQNLARAELQVTYGTLFRRIPGLRLAVDFSALRFKLRSNFYGLHELPVTW